MPGASKCYERKVEQNNAQRAFCCNHSQACDKRLAFLLDGNKKFLSPIRKCPTASRKCMADKCLRVAVSTRVSDFFGRSKFNRLWDNSISAAARMASGRAWSWYHSGPKCTLDIIRILSFFRRARPLFRTRASFRFKLPQLHF